MSQLDDLYAPPKARPEVPRKRRSREPEFSSEARSVGLVVLLSIVTLGVYPGIWFIRRQPFIDALDSDQKLGKALAWAPLVTFVVLVVSAVLSLASGRSPLRASANLAPIFAACLVKVPSSRPQPPP